MQLHISHRMNQTRIFWLCAILLSSTKIIAGSGLPGPPPSVSTTTSTDVSTTHTHPTGPLSDFILGGTSYPLQEKQCEFGTRIDTLTSPSEFAEINLLYIDTDNPSSCSGRVATWEVCYQTRGLDLLNTFDLLLLSKVSDGYNVRTRHAVSIKQEANIEQTTDFVSCTYIRAMQNISVFEGDYIGFICNNDISIGFSPLQKDAVVSTLHVFNLTSLASIKRQVSDINTVPSTELQRVSNNVVHLFRIIIDETMPTSTPCEGGPTTIWTPVFTAVVIASAVVIFVLFIMVFLMGCCICQMKFKCCKYFKRCCRCCKQKRAAHRITVEPITDQSMQYNDLYVPRDPSQNGEQHRVNIRGNPAYDTPQSNKYSATAILRAVPSQDALSTATELSTLDYYDSPTAAGIKTTAYQPDSIVSLPFVNPTATSDMGLDMRDIFEESREFDHTYEMIESGKIVK